MSRLVVVAVLSLCPFLSGGRALAQTNELEKHPVFVEFVGESAHHKGYLLVPKEQDAIRLTMDEKTTNIFGWKLVHTIIFGELTAKRGKNEKGETTNVRERRDTVVVKTKTPLTLTGFLETFPIDRKLSFEFPDDNVVRVEHAPGSKVRALYFDLRVPPKDAAPKAPAPEESAPKGVGPEDDRKGEKKESECVHVLYVKEGARFRWLNDFGDGPYLSSGRYLEVFPGMRLELKPDGRWKLKYYAASYGGPARISWDLTLRFVKGGIVETVPLKTYARGIDQTRSRNLKIALTWHSGYHPAIQEHFDSILADARLERRGHVVFQSAEMEMMAPLEHPTTEADPN